VFLARCAERLLIEAIEFKGQAVNIELDELPCRMFHEKHLLDVQIMYEVFDKFRASMTDQDTYKKF